MAEAQGTWSSLLERVRQGDAAATARLRQQLEPRLLVMVARALAAESTALPLTRWVRRQAAQAAPALSPRTGEARACLLALLARRLCDWLLERLQAGGGTHWLQETIGA
jgi:hypothetical protein